MSKKIKEKLDIGKSLERRELTCVQDLLSRPLVWWRDVPIDVEAGLLSYLSKVWNNDIYVIAANGYEQARQQCNWGTESYANVCFITGKTEIEENARLLDQLIADKDVLHLASGIKGGHRIFLDRLNKQKERKCVFIMESPSLFGSLFKRIIKKLLYPVLYHGYFFQYKRIASGLFSMGHAAVKQYNKYGWKKTLEFVYLPLLERKEQVRQMSNDTLRMLYIGRFDFKVKGVDIIMQAVDMLPKDLKWRIDLVGGYGVDSNRVISWCEHTPQVRYVGTWPSNEAVEKMAQYDFCIVPSRYDGWNMTPQQAIYAGIGCIVTNGAGSQDIIQHSGAGCVVPKGNSIALSKAIEKTVKNPGMVENWKKNAREYVHRISIDCVGSYFIDGLNYFYGYTDRKPQIPW